MENSRYGEMVDAQAWGVCGHNVHPGSSPGNGKKRRLSTEVSKVLVLVVGLLYSSLCKNLI